MNENMVVRDPGWGYFHRGLRDFFWVALMKRPNRAKITNPLVQLRQIQMGFIFGLVMGGVIAFLIAPSLEAVKVSLLVIVFLAPIVFVAIAFGLASARSLAPSSAEGLAGQYRALFFARLAFVLIVALLGFVGVILTGEAWVYLTGAAIAAVSYFVFAPSRANIERASEKLRRTGSELNLLAVLQQTEFEPSEES